MPQFLLLLLSQLAMTSGDPTASAHEGGRLVVVETRPTPLLPPERLIPASCMWGETPVWCQQACSCVEVLSRLEAARIDIEQNWADTSDWTQAMKGWRIFITNQQFLKAPTGALIYGVVFGDEKRMVLSRDMCGVLHELIHVHEIFQNRSAEGLDHPLWERNSAIKEISQRFVNRFRGKAP